MAGQWTELFIYFEEQIDEIRKFIKHELTELRNQFRGVYTPNVHILLFRFAKMCNRPSSLSDVDRDAQIETARTHVFITGGNRGKV